MKFYVHFNNILGIIIKNCLRLLMVVIYIAWFWQMTDNLGSVKMLLCKLQASDKSSVVYRRWQKPYYEVGQLQLCHIEVLVYFQRCSTKFRFGKKIWVSFTKISKHEGTSYTSLNLKRTTQEFTQCHMLLRIKAELPPGSVLTQTGPFTETFTSTPSLSC